jgi:hypothetical protein
MFSCGRFLRLVRVLALGGVAPLCLLAGCAFSAGPLGYDCRYGCDVYAKAKAVPDSLAQIAPAPNDNDAG